MRTGEQLRVTASALPPPAALNRFFRCQRDGTHTSVDPRLVVAAHAAARRFRLDRVEIVSAFRSRDVNRALRKAGRAVARRSRHVHGQALDIRLPGVDPGAACRFFRRRRIGGVGCYRNQHFIHIDVGPVRWWNG